MNIGEKWAEIRRRPLQDYTELKPNDSVSYCTATLNNIEQHKLKMKVSPLFLLPTESTSEDSIKYAAESAEYMIREHLSKDAVSREINVFNPLTGFFEGSTPKYDSSVKKWKIENKNPYEDTFNLFKDSNPTKSYIKSLLYDPQSGNTEVEAETLNFDYEGYENLKDRLNSISIPNEKSMAPFKQEYKGEFFLPEPPNPSEECFRRFPEYLPDMRPLASPSFPYYTSKDRWENKGLNKKGKIRLKLKRNLIIINSSRAQPISNIAENERVAIETLREMISEAEFRKYITHGFVLVKGQSGYIYQIFRNQAHTKVWKNGIVIKEVCVRIEDDEIPPTDNVIAFKVLIEGSEDEFEKLGNVYKMVEAA